MPAYGERLKGEALTAAAVGDDGILGRLILFICLRAFFLCSGLACVWLDESEIEHGVLRLTLAELHDEGIDDASSRLG